MSDFDPDERKRREKIIADDFGGIYPPHEAFYIEAIVYAAGRAVEAFDRYDAAVAEGSDYNAIVSNIHEALSHTAAVSRFFWPPRSKSSIPQRRSQKLREAFKITDGSPLSARDVRNTLEHFDEQLDDYLLNDPVGLLFPGALVGTASLADEELGHIFRLVDPKASIFVLLGRKYPYGDLRRAVAAVYQLSREAAGHGGRLPRSS